MIFRPDEQITVSLDDLAKALDLPEPTVLREVGGWPTCAFCHKPAGAHYCPPREEARHRLKRLVQDR